MNQDDQKKAIAAAALEYVLAATDKAQPIGIGTGSTANCFIDLLGQHKDRFTGAVPSSEASADRLRDQGIPIMDFAESGRMTFYVDGADEINSELCMIKGGGAALTREKIVASMADRFICIADESKQVEVMGRFPLPIEVIPMAAVPVSLAMQKVGGNPVIREGVTTDNGNIIIDVQDLEIVDAQVWEESINQIPGVVTNGIFAYQRAEVLFTFSEDQVVKVST
jgi:ribose 5-phosphate isomerase A